MVKLCGSEFGSQFVSHIAEVADELGERLLGACLECHVARAEENVCGVGTGAEAKVDGAAWVAEARVNGVEVVDGAAESHLLVFLFIEPLEMDVGHIEHIVLANAERLEAEAIDTAIERTA